jgi:hypothetical protein
MSDPRVWSGRMKRRGAVAVLTVVSSAALIGFAALAIDIGMLIDVRAELQRTADASALAGAAKLLDPARLKSTAGATDQIYAARLEAQRVAALNTVCSVGPTVNAADILVGYLSNPSDLREALSYSDPTLFNTTQVRVRRDSSANGPIDLWFAQIFGYKTVDLSASAAATVKDGAVGYRATARTGNAGLLPLALHVDAWRALLARTGVVGDNYTFDPNTRTISQGADGIPELNLYPGSGTGQLPPGNFGTVNIGPSNNSTSHLSSQIRYGVTPEDLSYYGGELKLGPDGTLLLNGDTGLSAAIKDDLEAIKGTPRSIPLFRQVTGNGNNAMYTIVGFAGIRIMNVKLTGAMQSKHVIIEPAFVMDDSVITTAGEGTSYFVYEPPRLVR